MKKNSKNTNSKKRVYKKIEGRKLRTLQEELVKIQKMPKSVLENSYEIINIQDRSMLRDRNTSCANDIHQTDEGGSSKKAYANVQALRIQLARKYLLRRDWFGLAKVLASSNPSGFSMLHQVSLATTRQHTLCRSFIIHTTNMTEPAQRLRDDSLNKFVIALLIQLMYGAIALAHKDLQLLNSFKPTITPSGSVTEALQRLTAFAPLSDDWQNQDQETN